MSGLLAELKRRNVIRMAGLYLVGAWLIVQVAGTVLPMFGAPDWLPRSIVILLAIGFVPTLIFAWIYELTPQGLKRDAQVTPQESIAPQTARRMDRMIIAVLIIALVYFAADKFVLAPQRGAQAGSQSGTAARSSPNAPRPKSDTDAVPADAGKSIAVLPLFNLGGDDKDGYLGDGISEEVLTALSRLPGLKVVGRASSFQFRGRDVDTAKVGRDLNVRNLLSGTVQRAGNDLRITVELIETATGVQLWTQHYDRSFKNLFALEDDISGAVSQALTVKLGAGEKLVSAGTASPHAHDLYLRAKQFSARTDEAGLNQAIVLFNQALTEDPNYAAAWADLALAYVHLADAYRAPNDLLPAMRGAGEKAVALDPALADGHAYFGLILLEYAHDFPAARRELERAIALNPGSADVHNIFGWYWHDGEHNAAAARAEMRLAAKIDPLNPWNAWGDMYAAIAERDFAGAQQSAARVIQLDPGFFYHTDMLEFVSAAAGRWQECLDRNRAVQATRGDQPDYVGAICHAHAGDTQRARDILRQLEAITATRYWDSSEIAAIRTALGDADGAFAALDQSYHDRSAPLMSAWMLPWFEPLHADPRFAALLDKIGAGPQSQVQP